MAKKLRLDELGEYDSLLGGVISIEGVRLLDAGEACTDQETGIMREFGFDPVLLAANDVDQEETIASLRHTAKSIEALGDDEAIAVPIYDNTNRLMYEAGEPIPRDKRAELKALGLKEVMVEKPLAPDVELRVGRFFMRLGAARKQTRVMRRKFLPPGTIRLDTVRIIADPAAITEAAIEAQVESAHFEDQPAGEPLIKVIAAPDIRKRRETAHVREMAQLHDDVVRAGEQIFAQIRASKDVSRDLIAGLSAKVVTGLINDPAMTLNLSGLRNSKHYIVSHSINTTLLSISIAAALGYSKGQVLEIAYGAFLHDVGMMRIAPEIVHKPGPLDKKERLLVQQHPVIGLNILQGISGLPKSAPLIVYQENERIDGTGYPKGRGPALIHSYAKIVAVAATYDAMTSERPYRPAKLPYYAMEELLNLVSLRKYDTVASRALLKVMSLFPIGSWIRLEDGSMARVVGANPDSFTRPIVAIIFDGTGKQLERPHPINLADKANEDLRVLDPVAAPDPAIIRGDHRIIGF